MPRVAPPGTYRPLGWRPNRPSLRPRPRLVRPDRWLPARDDAQSVGRLRIRRRSQRQRAGRDRIHNRCGLADQRTGAVSRCALSNTECGRVMPAQQSAVPVVAPSSASSVCDADALQRASALNMSRSRGTRRRCRRFHRYQASAHHRVPFVTRIARSGLRQIPGGSHFGREWHHPGDAQGASKLFDRYQTPVRRPRRRAGDLGSEARP